MGITPKNWETYFHMGSEGIGTLYERLVLDSLLERIVREYGVWKVLECPCFGMTGYTGINSLKLAKMGLEVYVVDDDPKRLAYIRKVWRMAGLTAKFVRVEDYSTLPFEGEEFDMVWNFASLWYLDDPIGALVELARVCGDILLICLPNRNLFYPLRKVFERDLWRFVDESVLSSEFGVKMHRVLKNMEFELVERGYIDTPPWPDLAIRLGRVKFCDKIVPPEYLNRKNNTLLKYLMFLESLPNSMKSLWSHHVYRIFRRRKAYQSTPYLKP